MTFSTFHSNFHIYNTLDTECEQVRTAETRNNWIGFNICPCTSRVAKASAARGTYTGTLNFHSPGFEEHGYNL